jgi:hypothetical protein
MKSGKSKKTKTKKTEKKLICGKFLKFQNSIKKKESPSTFNSVFNDSLRPKVEI